MAPQKDLQKTIKREMVLLKEEETFPTIQPTSVESEQA